MKKTLQKLAGFAIATTLSTVAVGQTPGTLTFTFTQVAHSPCYSGSKNVLAV